MSTNNQEEETSPRRAAIYARTAISQEKGNFAQTNQVEQCKAYCQERGYVVDEQHIYSEVYSGIANYRERPRLGEVLQMVASAHSETPPFDKFIVFSIDRLSRDQVQAATIINELENHHVKVEFVDGHDLEDFMKLTKEVTELVAQIEHQTRIRRMQHGKAAKKSRREQQQD